MNCFATKRRQWHNWWSSIIAEIFTIKFTIVFRCPPALAFLVQNTLTMTLVFKQLEGNSYNCRILLHQTLEIILHFHFIVYKIGYIYQFENVNQLLENSKWSHNLKRRSVRVFIGESFLSNTINRLHWRNYRFCRYCNFWVIFTC